MSSQARRTRRRSIRLRLALVFVVPLIALLALWAFAASVTYTSAISEHNFSSENALYGGPAQKLSEELSLEQTDVFDWLSSGEHTSELTVLAQFKTTQKAVTAFLDGVRSSSISANARPELAHFESLLAGLPTIEDQVKSMQVSALAAFQSYDTVIDAQFPLYSRLVSVSDISLNQQVAASVEAGESLDLADREASLISGAIVDGGRMSTAERQLFAQTVANQRLLMSAALGELNSSDGSGYRRAVSSADYKTFQAIDTSVVDSIGSKRPIPVNAGVFATTALALFRHSLVAAESQDRTALTHQGTQVGNKLLLELGLVGGVGLIFVFLSVYLLARFGGLVSRELRRLQRAAIELSSERLPSVVGRLSEGEDVDVAAEVSPLPVAHITEVAKVSEAFGTVQRMAVESAVGQARLRNGVNQVFRNLAWRSQSLLHRQLAQLDAMERKTTEPEALDELFRLDHLTTRMRRHAESLIILSGTQPGRAWRDPVPILDVLRGAVAEIEDYKRVTVTTDAEDAVVGTAVADLIHLLAELIENATFYSPNSTEVQVRAGRVANGFVVEIEDRGIGIGEEGLDRINERLANPPEFDPVNSDQLGLFVVARLAARHRIKVTIRQSPYGGTEAVVLLPHQIVVARGRASVASDSTMADWLPLPGRAAAIAPLPAPGIVDAGPPWPVIDPSVLGAGASEPDTGPEPPDGDRVLPLRSADNSAPALRPAGDGAPPFRPAGDGALPVRSAEGGALPVRPAGGSALPRRIAGASLAPRHAAAPDTEQEADGESGDGVSGPAAEASAAASVTGVVPPPARAADGPPAAVGVVGSTPAGLPRRVRQASLAPQLKTEVSGPVGDDPEPQTDEGRSPDESRALVDALQFGWQRGRAEADADDGLQGQAARTEDAEGT
jgi:signal transduction histidine kinase